MVILKSLRNFDEPIPARIQSHTLKYRATEICRVSEVILQGRSSRDMHL